MSGFQSSWLALREPVDLVARDQGLMRRAANWLAVPGAAPLVADLGCGTGATLGALEPALRAAGCRPRWRLIDNDPALLALAAERASKAGLDAETQCRDLSDAAAIPIGGARLVTASALFDLAAEDFVSALAEALAGANAGLYATLNYDGSTEFRPTHPLDGIVVAGFNRHQLRPKGLGRDASLGPAAARRLAAAMTARGYDVELADSPWMIGPEHLELAAEHIGGMADAVAELGVLDPAELEGWRRFRLENVGTGQAIVGHLDLLAIPPSGPQ